MFIIGQKQHQHIIVLDLYWQPEFYIWRDQNLCCELNFSCSFTFGYDLEFHKMGTLRRHIVKPLTLHLPI